MTITKILGVRARKISVGLGFASKSSGVNQDLCSNTGLNSLVGDTQTGSLSSFEPLDKSQNLQSGVDCLMGTIHDGFKDIAAVRELVLFVGSAISDTFEQLPHGVACGIQWHPYLWQSVLYHCQISCQIDDNGKTHLWISITGKACRVDQQNLARLICYLAVNGFCCTRIDCATTDPKNRLAFRQIHNAIKKGDASGFRPEKALCQALPNEKDGWTQYCGVKGGGKSFTRIYRKPDADVRIERQFVKRDARIVFADLAHYYDNRDSSIPLVDTEYFRKICAYSISGISFIHRVSKNLSRCPELRWWSAFKKACEVEPIKFPPVCREENLETKKAWVERSVATSLAMIKKWMGASFFDWLHSIISNGAERFTKVQVAILHHATDTIAKKQAHFTGNLEIEVAEFLARLKLQDEQIYAGLMDF